MPSTRNQPFFSSVPLIAPQCTLSWHRLQLLHVFLCLDCLRRIWLFGEKQLKRGDGFLVFSQRAFAFSKQEFRADSIIFTNGYRGLYMLQCFLILLLLKKSGAQQPFSTPRICFQSQPMLKRLL